MATDLEALKKQTQRQLLEAAKKLGLVGVSKLGKDKLAARLHEAMQRGGERKEEPGPAPGDASFPAKFDLGQPAGPPRPVVEDIPWSYEQDRVTAMAIDPNRLFAYWEITDGAIERARAGLGKGGRGAWLNLRVYDTSGRIFDGTNAHSTLDHKVERHDRQWFFHLGRPGSSAVVELGLLSHEGYFVRTSRSGRVDFPRSEPVSTSGGAPQWLTVRAGVPTVEPGGAEAAGPGAGGSPSPAALPSPPPSEAFLAALRDAMPERSSDPVAAGAWERVEWHEVLGSEQRDSWSEAYGQVEWQGPMTVTTWEAGPFAHPVEVAPPTRETWQGQSAVYRLGGVAHVVYGPWQVIIRNVGGHREHEVLSRWEARWQVWRSWLSERGHELDGTTAVGPDRSITEQDRLMPGASGRLGASERLRLLGASELQMGGASERFRIGASELRFRGASERLWRGASERRLGGASERLIGGASERLIAGASQRLIPGASERVLGGASEGAYPQAPSSAALVAGPAARKFKGG